MKASAKNPFSDFGPGVRLSADESETPRSKRAPLPMNLFKEFKAFAPVGRDLPMDRILASHESAIERLTEGYKLLLSDEADGDAWKPDGDTIARLYVRSAEIVDTIRPNATEIEAFCLYAMRSEDADFFLMGPLGLYLSALCNASSSSDITIDCQGEGLRLPLVGYRLEEGRCLTVLGDLGDLIGISLDGGTLKVGSVGRYLGAGMTSGSIEVRGDAGRFVGEQMTGGVIRIEGELGGMGKPVEGEVWNRVRRVYPVGSSGERN